MGTKRVTTPTVYQAEVKEDPKTKELYFNLPSGLLESLGWTEEDELEWYETHEGDWALRKVKDPAKKDKDNEQ